MDITIERVDSGYYHIRGEGPCNWWQGPNWPPLDDGELRAGFFPEAGEAFRTEIARRVDLYRGDDGLISPPLAGGG